MLTHLRPHPPPPATAPSPPSFVETEISNPSASAGCFDYHISTWVLLQVRVAKHEVVESRCRCPMVAQVTEHGYSASGERSLWFLWRDESHNA